MTIPRLTEFEWDKGNKDKNWIAHKVDYKECEETFFDKKIKFFQDPGHSATESRYLAYGQTGKKSILTIVFTLRGTKIRVISARDQNQKERRIYEQD